MKDFLRKSITLLAAILVLQASFHSSAHSTKLESSSHESCDACLSLRFQEAVLDSLAAPVVQPGLGWELVRSVPVFSRLGLFPSSFSARAPPALS